MIKIDVNADFVFYRWSIYSSSGSGSTVMIEAKSEDKKDEPGLHDLDLPGVVGRPTTCLEDILLSRRMMSGHTACDSSADSDSSGKGSVKVPKPKHFYKFQYLPKKFLKIRFDRLALLALLDRLVCFQLVSTKEYMFKNLLNICSELFILQ